MQAILIQLFQLFTPIVQKIIAEYKAAHNGATPTDAQMVAIFTTNIDTYLAEGQAWLDAHPKP